jgi:hypothetical protein
MIVLQMVLFLLVALAGTCTVLVRDPLRQAILFSLYGSLLTILWEGSQMGTGHVCPVVLATTLAGLSGKLA